MTSTFDAGRTIALLVDRRQSRNRFGRYAGEILIAEGITDFEVVELAEASPERLGRYGVVILTECGATAGLVELLAAYVEGGGQLVVLRPPLDLAGLLGLTPLYRIRRRASLLLHTTWPFPPLSTSEDVCSGFPYDPVALPSSLDLYQLAGGGTTVLARSIGGTGHWPVEPYPAIITSSIGKGRIVAFLYDLARAVAWLRQGDPELAESDTDTFLGVRPSDALIELADPLLAERPQAEIHAALFARVVEWLCPWPLPRLWYFPDGASAMVILSGDVCNIAPEAAFLEEADCFQQHGGHMTFYLHAGTDLSPATAEGLLARGHDLAIHPYAMPLSVPTMATTLADHVRTFTERFGFQPRTVRHHCLQWLGWAEQAKLEHDAGLDMDFNFVNTRPVRNGYMFGAGRPIRFVDEGGTVVDCWQQPTQFEDDVVLGTHDSGLRVSSEEACVLYDRLLDEASGPWDSCDISGIRLDAGNQRRTTQRWGGYSPTGPWHTAIAINLHPGNFTRYSGDWGRHVAAYTARRGVPMWNAARWLDFTRDRASLTVARPIPLGPSTQRWRIRVDSATPSAEIVLLIPTSFGGTPLQQPRAAHEIDLYGRRYLALPMKGAPLDTEAVYG